MRLLYELEKHKFVTIFHKNIMSLFRNLLSQVVVGGGDPDTFICKIKNTNTDTVTPYIAFPVRSAYSGIPSITVTIETSSGQSQTLTITGTDLTTKNDTTIFSLGRIDYFSNVSMDQDETATVTIYSYSRKFPSFSFQSSNSSVSYAKPNGLIYEVVTPLPVFIDGYCGGIFCGLLTSSFPENLFQYGKSIKTLEYTFAYTKLTTVPEGLFRGLVNVENLYSLFYRSFNLTSVPARLFRDMSNVTNISYIFNNCTSLTTVDSGVFEGMTNVTSLSNLFSGCPITYLPEGLFNGMTKVTNISALFNGCSRLANIPAGLFSGMTEVTSLSNTFGSCTSLTTIPSDLFSGMTKVVDLTNCFSNCSALTSVPVGLFREQVNATRFNYCFRYVLASAIHPNIFCDEATEKTTRFANVKPDFTSCFDSLKGTVAGTAPALWEYTYNSTPTKTKCFNGNSSSTLSNYNDIPTEWIS